MKILLCCGQAFYEEFSTFPMLKNAETLHLANREQICGYLSRGDPAPVAIVALDGKEGKAICQSIRYSQPKACLIWVSDQKEFEGESKNIPVTDFFWKPVPIKWLFNVIAKQMEKTEEEYA
ncbi:hypothetical protein [Acidaminobacterium chupaoyuni]